MWVRAVASEPRPARLHWFVASLSVASLPFHRLFSRYSSRTKGLPLTKRSGGRVKGHQSAGKVHFFFSPSTDGSGSKHTNASGKNSKPANWWEDASRGQRTAFLHGPLISRKLDFHPCKGSEPELGQITTNQFQVKEIRQSEALTECVASNVAAYATTRLAFQLKLLSGALITWKLRSWGSLPVPALAVSGEHLQRLFLSTSV
jgi:hypothetical protein